MAETARRYAVVTGANKGIGFGICKQLASNGITVVLTARNEKRGLEAVDKLRELGLSEYVVFHQLDVTDPTNVAALADFVKSQFGKLDILINNAGIPGVSVEADALAALDIQKNGMQVDWSKVGNQNYELVNECLETNYYGARRLIEATIPLLQLSTSPTIVNVSSSMGMLKNIPSESVRGALSDIDNLTEEKLDEVLNEFLKDFKDGALEGNGWPTSFSAYIMSKACLNAYTRLLAKKYPSFTVNAVCPGFVKTDMNFNTGILAVDQGAESAVRLALLPNNDVTGLFFQRSEVATF